MTGELRRLLLEAGWQSDELNTIPISKKRLGEILEDAKRDFPRDGSYHSVLKWLKKWWG